jgi:hypothetical protein
MNHFQINLTLKGGFYRSRHRFLGVLATVWCLAAFVFVNVYNSTLTSYLATSYNSPEVNSMEQLADNPNLKLITIKGSVADAEILVCE